MPIEGLLGLIRKHFSPSEGQILVSSLQQDPLVWQFAQDEEKSLPYFQNSNLDLKSFQPGYIAAWLINKTLDQPVGDLENSGTPLSEELKIRSNQAYDTAINSGLPPADLLSAGLIALALREKRNEKKNWQGISNETFVNSRLVDSKKLFQLWRTPFACLYSLCTDFDDLVTDFLHSENNRVLLQSVPVIIHTFLANGLPNESLVNQLFNIFVNRSVDFQLEGLKWLETFKRRNLREKIAKSLLDTKKNIDFIASIFQT